MARDGFTFSPGGRGFPFEAYVAYDKGSTESLVGWEIEMKDDRSVGVVTSVVKREASG